MTNPFVLRSINENVNASIHLPSSKSISNRVLIIQALCDEKFEIENLSLSDDTQILQRLLQSDDEVLNAGEGGTTFRFLLAWLALKGQQVLLTGSARMLQRPLQPIIDALNTLGAQIEYLNHNGTSALKINPSKMAGGEIEIDATISSQFISSLLLIAPCLPDGLRIHLKGKEVSASYTEMTITLIKKFGVNASRIGSVIVVANQTYIPFKFKIEADWSAASYWYSIAALSTNANIFLSNLSDKSLQGDSVIASIMESFGVSTLFENEGVRLTKTSNTFPVFYEYDFKNCPDLFQTVCVVCAALNIPSKFTGLQTLQHKETDRLLAMDTELKKLNAVVKRDATSFEISKGIDFNTEAIISTYNDHRMAMAFAPLVLKTKTITIENPDVVSKSYPGFWEDMISVSGIETC